MQSSIAVLACIALVILDRLSSDRTSKQPGLPRKNLLKALITAIAEFHKTQCYFSAAIQIAAIVFALEVIRVTQEFTSAALLFTIATDSSIPVIFILVVIQRYGQQSWYLVLLSSCCLLLSLATLILSYIVFPNNNAPTDGNSATVDVCGNHTASALLSAWCGSDVAVPGLLGGNIIHSGWNWVLWCNCVMWFGFCFFEKAVAIGPTSHAGFAQALQKRAESLSIWRSEKPATIRVYHALFLITWSITFGYQFYLYSLPFAYKQISTTWTFGQIVAITVWAPCIAEFLHLERSKCSVNDCVLMVHANLTIAGMTEGSRYRLPKGFAVISDSLDEIASAHSSEKDHMDSDVEPRIPDNRYQTVTQPSERKDQSPSEDLGALERRNLIS